MRVMVIVKATKKSEAGVVTPDDRTMFEQMGKFNDELEKAGILLAADGLHPSSKGKRVLFEGDARRILDGPFTETKELIAGFWIWKVKSMDEALAWARRCPDPMPGEEAILEIRPIHEAEDLAAMLTPELKAQEDRRRAEADRQREA